MQYMKEKKSESGKLKERAKQYRLFNDNLFSHSDMAESEKFTFIDLFAGIGGFRIAMQSLGGKCLFSSEWDDKAQQTYAANFGEIPFGDITTEETKSHIPKEYFMCRIPMSGIFYCRQTGGV